MKIRNTKFKKSIWKWVKIFVIALLVLTNCITGYYGINTHKKNLDQQIIIEDYTNSNNELQNIIIDKDNLIKEQEVAILDYEADFEALKSEKGTLVYLGTFTITHYCCENYPHICGNGDGLTAMGTKVQTGVSVAVDRKKIPLGTKVYIQGYGLRLAEDVGGGVKGNQIDVAVDTHEEAMRLGVRKREVWIIV